MYSLPQTIEWARVVAVARECTAIFNGIDYGGFLDAAIASLCYALSIPYITGKTSVGLFAPSEHGLQQARMDFSFKMSITADSLEMLPGIPAAFKGYLLSIHRKD